eukprot:CAMPEP_0194443778 /NCGR_PEP_ID=MMETSP0176-20130528/126901_1 /TAXON_ID=216777 /ORGANISM="Proboscia alata, Strain PI-D3" /LENGTH=323 /DNA_ID=CAMNT_0039270073 /DNA_START=38 /DNA_END=1009 /DNA_ORIENTATION=+
MVHFMRSFIFLHFPLVPLFLGCYTIHKTRVVRSIKDVRHYGSAAIGRRTKWGFGNDSKGHEEEDTSNYSESGRDSDSSGGYDSYNPNGGSSGSVGEYDSSESGTTSTYDSYGSSSSGSGGYGSSYGDESSGSYNSYNKDDDDGSSTSTSSYSSGSSNYGGSSYSSEGSSYGGSSYGSGGSYSSYGSYGNDDDGNSSGGIFSTIEVDLKILVLVLLPFCITIVSMLYTAHAMIEHPDGRFATCCRRCVIVMTYILGCLGYSSNQNSNVISAADDDEDWEQRGWVSDAKAVKKKGGDIPGQVGIASCKGRYDQVATAGSGDVEMN